MWLQKCRREAVPHQVAARIKALQLEDAAFHTERDKAEQEAKAAAKKAKKQRQKAKKQLAQPQAEATVACSSESSGLQAQGPEPHSSKLPSSESQQGCAPLEERYAEGLMGEPQAAEHINQDSLDAGMLNIFRCPITKVGKLLDSHMHCQCLRKQGDWSRQAEVGCGAHRHITV